MIILNLKFFKFFLNEDKEGASQGRIQHKLEQVFGATPFYSLGKAV